MTSITLKPEHWYAWQMIPGYFDEHCIPYFSPIFMRQVTPIKSGKGILRLSFWNVGYAEGVQDFEQDIHVLHRGAEYLVGRIYYGFGSELDRCAVISNIEFGWIEKFCPWVLQNPPGLKRSPQAEDNVHNFLNSVFLPRRSSMQ